MWIACFDIGYRNLACYVENVPVNTNQWNRIHSIQECMMNGETIWMECINLVPEYDSIPKSISQTILFQQYLHKQLEKYLLSRFIIWQSCSLIFIEKQLVHKNPLAEQLSHYTSSFFQYVTKKHVHWLPSSSKIKWLNGPSSQDKKIRKKWVVDQSIQLLMNRYEWKWIRIFLSYAKQDDISDCICLLHAFKWYWFVQPNKKKLFSFELIE